MNVIIIVVVIQLNNISLDHDNNNNNNNNKHFIKRKIQRFRSAAQSRTQELIHDDKHIIYPRLFHFISFESSSISYVLFQVLSSYSVVVLIISISMCFMHILQCFSLLPF